MRIARVLTRLNLGGPARQVLASDPLLAARGHELRLFVGRPEPGEGDLFEAALTRGLDMRRVDGLARGPNPLRDLRGRSALIRELAAFRPHLIHTHAAKAGALGRSAGWAVTDAPLVHTFHGHVLEGYFPRFVARRMASFERLWATRSTRVLAVSEATAADLDRLGVVPRERITVVPPGIELDPLLGLSALDEPRDAAGRRWRAERGIDADDFVVLLLGRLAAVKRPWLALEAFDHLARAAPRARLVVVGDGDERPALEQAARALPAGVRERVLLARAVDDVRPVHAAADVVLCTSRSEGLPVALVEAAAAARPAVAVGVGGVPELVEHGRTGLLVDRDEGEPVQARALADALLRLERTPWELAELGRAARERARARHTAEALAGRLEGIYREAVAEGRRRAS